MPNTPYRLFAAVLAVAAFILCAAAPAPFRTVTWDAAKDGARKTYRAGDLTLTFSAGPADRDGDRPPMLTVASPRFGRASVTGAAGSEPLRATAVVTVLDPKASGPAIVLHTPTGDAHGGTRLDILDPVGGRWRVVHGGEWDGDFSVRPQRTAAGGASLQLYDDRFLYAFACYACSRPPPKVFTLVEGRWSDASADPAYAPVFRRAAAADKADCTGGEGGGQNGACAAYVAEAARLGAFTQAWAYLLAHYDKTDAWDWPTGCKVARVDKACPAGQAIRFRTYPEALRNVLQEAGYIPKG